MYKSDKILSFFFFKTIHNFSSWLYWTFYIEMDQKNSLLQSKVLCVGKHKNPALTNLYFSMQINIENYQ